MFCHVSVHDPFLLYLMIGEGIDFIQRSINTLPNIVMPRDTSLGSRLMFNEFRMRTVIATYKQSTLPRIVGGSIQTLGIHPDGRFIGSAAQFPHHRAGLEFGFWPPLARKSEIIAPVPSLPSFQIKNRRSTSAPVREP
jgi:hypothetical protein